MSLMPLYRQRLAIKRGQLIIMKMNGASVEILILKDPAKYQGYIVYENGKKVIYLKVL